jgi:uncharacterized membrane protein YphA (DoxX/SURF4 family)
MIQRILHWACRLFLGGIFIYAGYTKVENPLQFAAAIEAYKLLPPAIVLWVVKVLPWIEIVLGVCVLAGIMIRYTAALAGALLALFIAAMLVTYLRGIEADCGCFGIGERISPLTLARDTLFLLPAVFLAAQPWIEARRWLPRHNG